MLPRPQSQPALPPRPHATVLVVHPPPQEPVFLKLSPRFPASAAQSLLQNDCHDGQLLDALTCSQSILSDTSDIPCAATRRTVQPADLNFASIRIRPELICATFSHNFMRLPLSRAAIPNRLNPFCRGAAIRHYYLWSTSAN